jgi:hypothetical protein
MSRLKGKGKNLIRKATTENVQRKTREKVKEKSHCIARLHTSFNVENNIRQNTQPKT